VNHQTLLTIAIGAGTWAINTAWTYLMVRIARRESFQAGYLQGFVHASDPAPSSSIPGRTEEGDMG
jgi:hypothetical protein